MKQRNIKFIIAAFAIFIAVSTAVIIYSNTNPKDGFNTESGNYITEICSHSCLHPSYQKAYEPLNSNDHLINYICTNCGCIFESASAEHAFWDVENDCESTTCNLCDYTCKHPGFNGAQCNVCPFVCEHEIEFELSLTGGLCVKCGRQCCSHEQVKWRGDILTGYLYCPECGALYRDW